MEPDDLLCSRNARPEKALVGRAQWKINQPPSLKRKQPRLEGACISPNARSERQFGRPRWGVKEIRRISASFDLALLKTLTYKTMHALCSPLLRSR
jgi:hypothetical protein